MTTTPDQIVPATGTAGQAPVTTPRSQSERLSAPFAFYFSDVRGGIQIDYLSGEQITRRLLDVLGSFSFRVSEHGIDEAADEVWVLGRLEAIVDDMPVIVEQFGSQKLKRKRETGMILDIGFDLKGATTDALKKCASLLGVGLYLAQRERNPDGSPRRVSAPGERRPARQDPDRGDARPPSRAPAQSRPASAPASSEGKAGDRASQSRPTQATGTSSARPAAAATGTSANGQTAAAEWHCKAKDCGKPLQDVQMGAEKWSAQYLAKVCIEEFGRELCGDHYVVAVEYRAKHPHQGTAAAK